MITKINLRLQEIAGTRHQNPFSIAKASGLAYNTVHTIWTGKAKRVDLDTLVALCNTLDTTPDQLFQITRSE